MHIIKASELELEKENWVRVRDEENGAGVGEIRKKPRGRTTKGRKAPNRYNKKHESYLAGRSTIEKSMRRRLKVED